VAGEPGIRERDDRLGVRPGGDRVVDVVDTSKSSRDRHSTQLDVTVGSAQHEIRSEPLVMQSAMACQVEQEGGFTRDTADLGCRQRSSLEQFGQGLGTVQTFLDQEGEVIGRADVEDPR